MGNCLSRFLPVSLVNDGGCRLRNGERSEESHLPVDNDAPDESKDEFMISINDVRCSDIHQFHLEEREKKGGTLKRAGSTKGPAVVIQSNVLLFTAPFARKMLASSLL